MRAWQCVSPKAPKLATAHQSAADEMEETPQPEDVGTSCRPPARHLSSQLVLFVLEFESKEADERATKSSGSNTRSQGVFLLPASLTKTPRALPRGYPGRRQIAPMPPVGSRGDHRGWQH